MSDEICGPVASQQPESIPAAQIKWRFSRIGWGLALMVAAQQGGGALLLLAVRQLWPALAQNSWFLMCANTLPPYLLGVPLLLLVMRGLPDLQTPAKARIRAGQLALLFFASMAAAYVLNILTLRLTSLIGSLKGGEVANLLDNLVGNSSPWAVLLFAVILAPVLEEFVFRWLLYKKLAAFGAKTYILFSALVFSLYHANPYQIFYAFALGLVMAGLTYYTGGIRASIALHLAVNLVGSGVPLLLSAFGSGSQLPMMLFGALMLLIGVAGLLSAIHLFHRRSGFPLPAGAYPPPTGRTIFGNAGMVLLLAALAGLTLFVLLV